MIRKGKHPISKREVSPAREGGIISSQGDPRLKKNKARSLEGGGLTAS